MRTHPFEFSNHIRIVFTFLIPALILSLLFTGCKKDEDNNPEYSIEGIWRVTAFTSNNTDILELFDIDQIFYEFESGGTLVNFVANENGSYTLTEEIYSLNNDATEVTINNNGIIRTASIIALNNSILQLEGEDAMGNVFEMDFVKYVIDRCSNVDCENGTCYYGYCLCDQGYWGADCSEVEGSIGSEFATIVYDKGSYNNGWRYIEVLNEMFIGKEWACTGFDVGDLTWNRGGGKENTEKIVAKCGNNTAAGFALNYEFMGYQDWYLPSRSDLGEICNKKSEISGYPIAPTGIWTSSDIGINPVGGRQPLVMNSTECDFSAASETIGYAVYLVRYF